MSNPSPPKEDHLTGVDNSSEEESLEGFYREVSLHALFDALDTDERDEGPVESTDQEPRSGSFSTTSLSAPDLEVPPNPASLAGWVAVYFRANAERAAPKTLSAKRLDLERFLNFTVDTLGHDHIAAWVPDLTRAFLRELQEKPSAHTGRRLAPASVRRAFATVRHFAGWVGRRHDLKVDPLHGVLAPRGRSTLPDPISRADLRRLWRVCRDRVDSPHRRDQCPLLDAAIFQLLVSTDLRPRELVALDLEDYRAKKLHGPFRRGAQIRAATWVPAEARRWLERYLDDVRGRDPGPLLLSRTHCRLRPKALKKALTKIGKGLRPEKPRESAITPSRLVLCPPTRLT